MRNARSQEYETSCQKQPEQAERIDAPGVALECLTLDADAQVDQQKAQPREEVMSEHPRRRHAQQLHGQRGEQRLHSCVILFAAQRQAQEINQSGYREKQQDAGDTMENGYHGIDGHTDARQIEEDRPVASIRHILRGSPACPRLVLCPSPMNAKGRAKLMSLPLQCCKASSPSSCACSTAAAACSAPFAAPRAAHSRSCASSAVVRRIASSCRRPCSNLRFFVCAFSFCCVWFRLWWRA